MARTRERMKGRRTKGSFSMLTHDYFTSPEYGELSPRAVKALIDCYTQFRGNNNGDLTAAWSIMAKRGWRSKDQLEKAIDELLDRGWIVVSRQGSRGVPTLYAVTFLGVDRCDGKLDITPNPAPLHAWKRPAKIISLPRPAGQAAPPHGASKWNSNAT
jgi:hypothetical protein